MKIITLALALFTFGVQAQNFPSPYCDLDETSIEGITSVDFANAEIINFDEFKILIDKTAIVADVKPGETYTISIKGDTKGNFDNNILAFVDWNQNDILDDENEIYEVGTLHDSDGRDGVSVSMNITVPLDAVLGQTRIRITKTYTDSESIAEINPCAIEMSVLDYGVFPGLGQALDFTLNVDENAAGFPSPYCDLDPTSVEEITSIDFANVNITNSDDSLILIDKTANVADLTPGETYTLTVEGDTKGDFDTNIVAFIDWNQNNLLDDADEIYEIGTITNSDGRDGISVNMDILVPLDAVPGPTRIRITKTFTDSDTVAEIDPCAISMNIIGYGIFPGFGQAIDFTLNLGDLGVNAFDSNSLSVFPIPTENILNINYKSEIKSIKVYNLLGQEVYTQNGRATNMKVDISSLIAGTYIVKLSGEQWHHSIRIVKQ